MKLIELTQHQGQSIAKVNIGYFEFDHKMVQEITDTLYVFEGKNLLILGQIVDFENIKLERNLLLLDLLSRWRGRKFCFAGLNEAHSDMWHELFDFYETFLGGLGLEVKCCVFANREAGLDWLVQVGRDGDARMSAARDGLAKRQTPFSAFSAAMG